MKHDEPEENRRAPIRTYGRRHGHRLRPRQQALVRDLLPRLRLPAHDAVVDPAALFASAMPPAPEQIWLEIGFGGGEHLIWQASRNPEIGFLGFEPYINGVARLLGEIDSRKLANIRLHDGDARDILPRLPQASIDRIFLLFPDPWPKKRHHKRRFVSPQTLAEFVRILRPGGEFRFASDIAGYVRWTLCHSFPVRELVWTARSPADWRNRPRDWPQTRYEAKARREGRMPAYLTFRRI